MTQARGISPLIPLPFVDEMAIRRISRRMYASLFAAHGMHLGDSGAKVLGKASAGWLRGAATSAALLPLKRLVRKVVYVLAIKDCADVASAVFHDGWLIAHMLERGPEAVRPGLSLADPRYLQQVRKAMTRTYRDIDPAPLRRALVGSFLGAKVGATHAVKAVRGLLRRDGQPANAAAEPEVDGLIARMRDAANGQWQYLEALERDFRHHLGLTELREELPAPDAA
jgi:uncharacterized protein (DUF697 family)